MEGVLNRTHLWLGESILNRFQLQFHNYDLICMIFKKGFVTPVYKVEARTKTKYFIQYLN